MKKKKWILAICIAVSIIALLMAAASVTSMMGYGVSVGKLYFTESSTYLIDGTTSIIVSDQSRKSNMFDGYANGDEIILVHDGVEETFPARTGGYMAIRISKGDGTYKPSDDLLGIAVLEEFDETYVNQKLEYRAQYIRTNGYTEAFEYPSIRIMESQQDLSDYYNTWHEVFDLERREQVYSDSTIGFLDACDRYDEAFFESNYLIFVLLEEPSGSIRHEVQSVEETQDEKLSISIDHQVPEVGTSDMAQWHIILELSREYLVESPDDVELYVYGIQYANNAIPVVPQTEDTHLHMTALTPQIVEDPVTGYCGNTQTRLYIDGKEYWFMYGNSVTLSDLLVNLDYDPGKVCRCMAQYTADTEFGTNYQINLDYGFVRCDLGQADLTQEQIQTIADIINWAETTNCQYTIDD